MIVSTMRPPTSPARMDSIGKPGTGDGGINTVADVEIAALELMMVLLTRVDVVIWIAVVVEVVTEFEPPIVTRC
jgi:hypothetical protein